MRAMEVRGSLRGWTIAVCVMSSGTALAQAREQPLPGEPPDRTVTPPLAEDEAEPEMRIYGHAMLDIGFDFGEIGDPLWEDVLRPTKLPAFEDEFGDGPRTFMGVRQSRFGVESTLPTDHGDVYTKFEFELFGVGPDEGQTTFRLRHAYGEWNGIIGGQTWSPFMDPDVFPNSIEYWGPNGMVFFRNVQLAYQPVQGDTRVTIALERPGASPDTGLYVGRIELEDIIARFPAPDVSAEARFGGPWGYVELAGILRWIQWDDLGTDALDLEGDELGWGLNLSSNVKLGSKVVLKLQAVYGEAIQNYMNDAGADIGVVDRPGDPVSPIDGEALPVFGLVAFADLNWSDLFTSTAGYSMVWVDNSDAQAPDAFHMGHYALANILYYPTTNVLLGPELQFGRRVNFDDGFAVNDYRIQFSIKYSFSKTLGGTR